LIKQAFKTVEWLDGRLRWLNTLKLPYREEYVESSDYERVAEAIERMEIRGAPAIGVAAAFAVALAALSFRGNSVEDLRNYVIKAIERLRRTRPTAVNLFWALNRVENVLRKGDDVEAVKSAIIDEAMKIYREDLEVNMKIGEVGSKVIDDGDTILTHCNAGALATAGFGTALGVVRAAWYSGKRIQVIATETRPVLQGARLTVWELLKDGVPVTLITDNMVGYVMSKGLVDKVIVGADRVLLSGHVINKIGTYTIAVLAKYHNVPFYVAAPTSTIDLRSELNDVVIEERNPDEVRRVLGKLLITVEDVPVLNPAFDITPPDLITGIITEQGIASRPLAEGIRKILKLR